MDPVRPVLGPSALARGAARRGTSGFSVHAEVAAGEGASRAEATAELFGLIAVQERDEGERRDRGAHKRCWEMLRVLAGLQRALLGGTLDLEGAGSARRAEPHPVDAANPELALLSRMIAVRARVELARAEVANLKIAQKGR